MGTRPYVFSYDNEPADERPTGFGETSFGHSGLAALSTVAAPWTVSQHSTFDEPSRSFDWLQARKDQRRQNAALFALVLLVVAIVASAIGLTLRSG